MSASLGEEASTTGAELFGQYDPDSSALLDNYDELFQYNSLADQPALPDFGAGIGNDFFTIGNDCPEQLSVAAYFDIHAFDTDTTGGFPLETSQPTSGLQSQFSASFEDGRRQGFAAETS